MKTILAVFCLMLFAMALPLAPVDVAAQTTQAEPAPALNKGKLLVPRRKDGTVRQTPFFESPVQWLREAQQQVYGELNAAVNRLRSAPSAAALWTLALLGFGYGVFHAAGPGHGKLVISAWLLATENDLKRGVLIAFMSAIVQALTAIILVSGLFLFFGATANALARETAGVLESASFAMIAAMGLYLIWTAVRAQVRAGHGHGGHHHAEHHHDHHSHGDAACQSCGHAHAPAPADVRGGWSLAKAAALAFSVGLRPCLGAVLVLLLTYAIGLYGAGIAAVFAMAFGTFLTVSAVAALSVYGKTLALRLASQEGRWASRLETGLRFGGGAVIAGLGGLLFWASLGGHTGMS